MNSRMYVPHKLFKIKDVGNVVTGITPSTKIEKYFNGTIPFVTPSELGKEAPIIKAATYLTDLGATQAKLVPKNAVLVCCIGSLGKVGFAGRELATNQQINTIVFNEEVVYPRYGYYVCRTLKPILINMASSTTIPIVNKTRFENLEIPVPPLEQQQRIAQVLDAVDSLLGKRREGLKKLEVLLKSVFLEMFGDPVTNPKDLPTRKLEEICHRVTDGTHQPPKWTNNGVPFLFISNIVDGEITFETSKFISEETHTELTRRCPIEIEDILYTTVGSYGNVAQVKTNRKFGFQRHIAHIKPNRDLVDSDFLCGMLESTGVRKQVDSAVKGVAQKTLNLSDLKEVLVFLPIQELQIKYVQIRQKLLVEKLHKKQSLSSFEKLFASLQHQAFNGTLTAGVLEREVQKLEEVQAVLF
jgi:type I restriction enzyme, S subunit